MGSCTDCEFCVAFRDRLSAKESGGRPPPLIITRRKGDPPRQQRDRKRGAKREAIKGRVQEGRSLLGGEKKGEKKEAKKTRAEPAGNVTVTRR